MTTTVTGLGCLGVLGASVREHCDALRRGKNGLRRLGELGMTSDRFDEVPAGWIEHRELLCHRKWSPLSMAALHVAREAVRDASWGPSELADAMVFFGSSRGAAAGWMAPWSGRRPFKLMAASNSLTSEPAAAVSAELGIEGPWQVASTGCCAGLDALSNAQLWIQAGKVQRALVVAADLPLVDPILQAYEDTGILANGDQPGLMPAEAAAAVCLEAGVREDRHELLPCDAAADPKAMISSGKTIDAVTNLLDRAVQAHGLPVLCVAHRSGTKTNRQIESQAIAEVLGSEFQPTEFKSRTGHGIGASALLELVLIAALTRSDLTPDRLHQSGIIFKLASALGGRHSLAPLAIPK